MEVKFISADGQWIRTLYELEGFVPRIGERVRIDGDWTQRVTMVHTDVIEKLIIVYLIKD